MNALETLLSRTPVVILAGGLGTRLRSVLPDQPKGLAPIGAKPFLQVQIELLRDQGARDFVLCVGHLGAHIQDQFGDGAAWGVRIQYSVEGGRLLGTAGALKLAERFFRPRALVLNGDTYLAVDYERLVQRHREAREEAGVLATLSLARSPDAGRYGTVLLDAAGQHLIGFKEKEAAPDATEQWLNAGAYVIEHDLLNAVRPNVVASLERDVLPAVLAAGHRVAALKCEEPFYDIGTPADLAKFIDHFMDVKDGRRKRAG
jgi:D-glycero-alpha-D-manno-heptose 1-phosphate guanylyltransferase